MVLNGSNPTEQTSRGKQFNNQGKKFPQYIAAISVCLGALAAGTVLGWTGNISEELQANKLNGIDITSTDVKWIGSCSNLGALFMCFPIGIMCEKIGRKLSMLLITLPFIAGWLLIVFANSVAMIFAGRVITGMAGGAFCVSAPLYTSEIAQKEIRGALGSYFQLFVTIGIMLAYVLGFAVDLKIYTIVVTCIPALFALAFLFQPETPVYSMKKKRHAEARAALFRLRGDRYDVDAELKEIRTAIEEAERLQISFKDSIRKRSTKKAALICFSLMFFQQAGGVNAVIFYTSTIFSSSGADLDPKIATIIVGVMQVVATFVSSLVVDKLGRRILLLASDIFMAVGLIILGVFFTLSERHLVSADTLSTLGFMPLLGLSLFIIVFSLGYGPIPWMISSELFPPEIKSVASAAVGTFNWFMAFLITNFYFDIKQAIGGDVTFYIFSGICILGTSFVFIFVPETKGKSLEQIQKELNGERERVNGFDNIGFRPEYKP